MTVVLGVESTEVEELVNADVVGSNKVVVVPDVVLFDCATVSVSDIELEAKGVVDEVIFSGVPIVMVSEVELKAGEALSESVPLPVKVVVYDDWSELI